MGFGLENVPGTFPRAMDVMLSTVNGPPMLEYLDEIVNFRKAQRHI